MIEVHNLSKSFGSKEIISNLNITFNDGKIYALSGQSGIGKTTFLRAISGLDKQVHNIIGLNNKKLSFIFPDDRLINNLTGYENIKLVCTDQDKINKLFDDFLLYDMQNLTPDKMSTGMKRRLSVVRSLAYCGDIFFWDEPFNGIDTKTLKIILPIIKEYVKNKTVIFITHSSFEINIFADFVVKFSGENICEYSIEQVKKEALL